jgi:hypothetical protein
MKKGIPCVYILEMKCSGKWEPTVGMELFEELMAPIKKDWEKDNPNDKFRISEYVRKEKP